MVVRTSLGLRCAAATLPCEGRVSRGTAPGEAPGRPSAPPPQGEGVGGEGRMPHSSILHRRFL
jgi:hypothetical protein